MKFCMEMITMKVTSTTYQINPVASSVTK